jgi:hypothetical protein
VITLDPAEPSSSTGRSAGRALSWSGAVVIDERVADPAGDVAVGEAPVERDRADGVNQGEQFAQPWRPGSDGWESHPEDAG